MNFFKLHFQFAMIIALTAFLKLDAGTIAETLGVIYRQNSDGGAMGRVITKPFNAAQIEKLHDSLAPPLKKLISLEKLYPAADYLTATGRKVSKKLDSTWLQHSSKNRAPIPQLQGLVTESYYSRWLNQNGDSTKLTKSPLAQSNDLIRTLGGGKYGRPIQVKSVLSVDRFIVMAKKPQYARANLASNADIIEKLLQRGDFIEGKDGIKWNPAVHPRMASQRLAQRIEPIPMNRSITNAYTQQGRNTVKLLRKVDKFQDGFSRVRKISRKLGMATKTLMPIGLQITNHRKQFIRGQISFDKMVERSVRTVLDPTGGAIGKKILEKVISNPTGFKKAIFIGAGTLAAEGATRYAAARISNSVRTLDFALENPLGRKFFGTEKRWSRRSMGLRWRRFTYKNPNFLRNIKLGAVGAFSLLELGPIVYQYGVTGDLSYLELKKRGASFAAQTGGFFAGTAIAGALISGPLGIPISIIAGLASSFAADHLQKKIFDFDRDLEIDEIQRRLLLYE